jgi:hypothetical protein
MRHSHMGATPRIYGMGATPRVYGMGAAPRVYGAHGHVHGMHHMGGMHHLGRSVLSVSAAKNYNRGAAAGSKGVKPSSVGSYRSMESNAFINDLWTAQLLALWVTNGNAFPEMGMSGVVTANGHNPADVAPLGIGANGVATTNVKSLFRSLGSDDLALKGPDGMFGEAADSVIAEWAGTGKLFGSSVPAGNAQIALNKLASQVVTPQIQRAKDLKAAGTPPAPKRSAAKTPCNELNPSARAARADCPPVGGSTGGGTGGTGGKTTPPKTTPNRTESAEDGDNTLLYAGIAGAAVLLGGVGYFLYSKRKSSGAL